MATTATPVAAHRDQQSCGPPAERLMSQLPCHGVTAGALLTAATAPPVRFGDPARQHSTIGLQALAGHLQPELIKAAESGYVRIGKGSVDPYSGTDAPNCSTPSSVMSPISIRWKIRGRHLIGGRVNDPDGVVAEGEIPDDLG